MASWAQLRQQARALESQVCTHQHPGSPPPLTPPFQTNDLFRTYSAFVRDSSPQPSDEEAQTESSLVDILKRRESVVASLSHILNTDAAAAASAAKFQNLTLSRSTLADHRREFALIRSNIDESRKHANLLTTVRKDVDSYQASSSLESGGVDSEHMLDEQNRISHVHKIADSVLGQAYAINSDLGEQRARLSQISRRAIHAASQIPGINVIVASITKRKRRDSIIMALLVAVCFWMVIFMR